MLHNILPCIIFLCVLKPPCEGKKPFLLKLTPEQVMQTFDDVMSDDYIKELAKTFAAKAASHFMKEIRNQKEALVAKLNNDNDKDSFRQVPARKRKDEVAEMVNAAKEAADEVVADATKELDENEALALLQDPSPDGDHQDSSGEFSEKEKKKIPVIQVTKINGIYYRRLLGMI